MRSRGTFSAACSRTCCPGSRGGHLLEGTLDRLVLKLPFVVSGAGAGPQAFSRELVSAIDAILDDAMEHAAAFRPGHAFCHRCGAASCEHSEPPSARHVFVGYAPTGTPRWEDFAQRCLDIGRSFGLEYRRRARQRALPFSSPFASWSGG